MLRTQIDTQFLLDIVCVVQEYSRHPALRWSVNLLCFRDSLRRKRFQ